MIEGVILWECCVDVVGGLLVEGEDCGVEVMDGCVEVFVVFFVCEVYCECVLLFCVV